MRLRPLLLAAALGIAWPTAARAGAPAAGVAPLDELLARLGSPADPDVVRALLRREATQGADGALRVVDALWAAGGHGAAEGFRQLVDHADPRVRERALRALGMLGLRGRDHMDRVRHAVEDDVEDVRLAAHEALARVGDAEDVPTLLTAAASSDLRLRQVALRALRTLTGERMGYVPARWTAWWPVAQPEILRTVEAALATLESGGSEAEIALAQSVVARRGWASLAAVETAVAGWLNAPDARLRAEAYRAAAALRLGDLAEDVGTATRYEGDAEALAVAQEAVKVLGPVPENRTRKGGASVAAGSAPMAPSSAPPAASPVAPPSPVTPRPRPSTPSPTIQGEAATAPPLPPR